MEERKQWRKQWMKQSWKTSYSFDACTFKIIINRSYYLSYFWHAALLLVTDLEIYERSGPYSTHTVYIHSSSIWSKKKIVLFVDFYFTVYKKICISLSLTQDFFFSQCVCVLFPVPEDIGGRRLTATVIELSPWVEYEFRVVAINALGTGEPSKPSKQVRTKDTRKWFKHVH